MNPILRANVPAGVDYGTVTGEFVSFVGDGTTSTPDGTPDEVPLRGYVIFTPTVQTMRWPTLVPPKTAVIATVRCPVIEGVLYAPGTSPDSLGDQGVALVASRQPTALPDLVQYTVSFEIEGAKTQPPSFRIDVPSQATVDLTTVMPATPEPGTVVVVSTVDRERAEAARGAAEAAADTAETAATVAVTARGAAEGFAGDAETALTSTLAAAVYELRGTGQPGSTTETNNAPPGTYYTDTAGTTGAWRWLKTSPGSGSNKWTVVYGDTGWRNVESWLYPNRFGLADDNGYLCVRRVNGLVRVEGFVKPLTAATAMVILPVPFRGVRYGVYQGAGYLGTTLRPVGVINSTDVLYLGGGNAFPGDTVRFWAEWPVGNAWPTTLPGTSASEGEHHVESAGTV